MSVHLGIWSCSPGAQSSRSQREEIEREERQMEAREGATRWGPSPELRARFCRHAPPWSHQSTALVPVPEAGSGKHPKLEVGGQGEGREGGKEGGCRGVEWVAWFQFGILPGCTRRRQSTSRPQRGSKLRGGPAAGVSDSPLDCHPPRVPGDGASWATIQTRGWWRGRGWRGRGASEFPGRVGRAGSGRSAAQRGAERQREVPGPARAAQRPQATSCSPWQRRQQP